MIYNCLSIFALLTIVTCKLKWEISNFTHPVAEVYHCKSPHLLLLTTFGHVYKSENQGKEWKNISPKIFNIEEENSSEDNDFPPPPEITEKDIDNISNVIFSIHQSKADPNFFFMQGDDATFISHNCGKSFKIVKKMNKLSSVKLHPWKKGWILLSKWKVCSRKEKDCLVNNQLFASFDSGKTIKLIQEFIVDYDWFSEDESCSKKHKVPDGRIIYSVDPQRKMHQQIGSWISNITLYYSDDFMKTSNVLLKEVNKFIVHKHWIYVSKIDDYVNQHISLWIEKADNKFPKLKKANLPTRKLLPSGFSILSDSKDALLLFVNHYSTDSPFGTILLGDESKKFSISARNVVRNKDRIVEFQKINTLKGVFMTNIIEENYISQFGVYNIMNNFKLESGHKQQKFQSSTRDNFDYERYIKTYISTDFGAVWEKPQYINETSTDILDENSDLGNEPYFPDCEVECELHFHINSLLVPPVKSHINAHGLVLANGNYGKYLEQRLEFINTFISRDGGLNWSLIGRGSYIYEFSKFGDVIVMVPFDKATEGIKYSTDYGKTWHYLVLDTKIQFLAIRREENLDGLVFYLSGIPNQNDDIKGSLVTIDFREYFEKICVKTDDQSSDYESWNPYSQKKCILGEITYYIRRKADSVCLNQLDLSKNSIKQCCECTDDDWECDVGFQRNITTGSCQRIHKDLDFKESEQQKPPKDCNGTYKVSSGYRKIKGSKCEMGVYYGPTEIPCPGNDVENSYLSAFFKKKETLGTDDPSELAAGMKTLIIGIIAIILGALMVKFKERIFKWIEFAKLKAGITNSESTKAYYNPINPEIESEELI